VTGRWFSPGAPVYSTNIIDRHDIKEILLKMALNTITLIPSPLARLLLNYSHTPSTKGSLMICLPYSIAHYSLNNLIYLLCFVFLCVVMSLFVQNKNAKYPKYVY
jgi:hypothetical protein